MNKFVIVAKLKEEGFTVGVCDDLVHAKMEDRLVNDTEIRWLLWEADNIKVWNSPWGVSIRVGNCPYRMGQWWPDCQPNVSRSSGKSTRDAVSCGQLNESVKN